MLPAPPLCFASLCRVNTFLSKAASSPWACSCQVCSLAPETRLQGWAQPAEASVNHQVPRGAGILKLRLPHLETQRGPCQQVAVGGFHGGP